MTNNVTFSATEAYQLGVLTPFNWNISSGVPIEKTKSVAQEVLGVLEEQRLAHQHVPKRIIKFDLYQTEGEAEKLSRAAQRAKKADDAAQQVISKYCIGSIQYL